MQVPKHVSGIQHMSLVKQAWGQYLKSSKKIIGEVAGWETLCVWQTDTQGWVFNHVWHCWKAERKIPFFSKANKAAWSFSWFFQLPSSSAPFFWDEMSGPQHISNEDGKFILTFDPLQYLLVQVSKFMKSWFVNYASFWWQLTSPRQTIYSSKPFSIKRFKVRPCNELPNRFECKLPEPGQGKDVPNRDAYFKLNQLFVKMASMLCWDVKASRG